MSNSIIDVLEQPFADLFVSNLKKHNPTPDNFAALFEKLYQSMLPEFLGVSFVKAMLPEGGLDPETADVFKRRIRDAAENSIEFVYDTTQSLVDDTVEPWLRAAVHSGRISWSHWKSYEEYLRKRASIAEESIKAISEVAEKVVDYVGDPQGPAGRRYGLLFGEVQSGKTAAYTGVMHKAVDAGWKVVIVLTANSNELRNQTQKRLNAEFSGYDAGTLSNDAAVVDRRIGVGMFGADKAAKVRSLTDNENDFIRHKTVESYSGSEVLLCVSKKERQTLQNIIRWVRATSAVSRQPCLIIDDEADNASINTSATSITTINRQIRELMQCFSRAGYVAVTATPFANIFIDPMLEQTAAGEEGIDLYPRHFIVPMVPPPAYVGVEKLFGKQAVQNGGLFGKTVMPLLESDEPSSEIFAKGELKPKAAIKLMPASLKTALRYFVCTGIYKDLRESDKSKATMLVHIARFIKHHRQLKRLIEEFLTEEKEAASVFRGLPPEELADNEQHQAYEKLWSEPVVQKGWTGSVQTFAELTGVPWERIWNEGYLYKALVNIDILMVNSVSDSSLANYHKENEKRKFRLIVIGGAALSRGITLVDLCTTYFSRKSSAEDTLLQMGRWFGYRNRILKYMKIWMSDPVIPFFKDCAEATRVFREQVFRMNERNMRPLDFGQWMLVPDNAYDGLRPTSLRKMRRSTRVSIVTSVKLQGLVQMNRFPADKAILEANKEALRQFLADLGSPDEHSSSLSHPAPVVWNNVAQEKIIDLLQKFDCRQWSDKLRTVHIVDGISSYPNKRPWRVTIVSRRIASEEAGLVQDFFGIGGATRCVSRSVVLEKPDKCGFVRMPQAALAGGGDGDGIGWVSDPVQYRTWREENNLARTLKTASLYRPEEAPLQMLVYVVQQRGELEEAFLRSGELFYAFIFLFPTIDPSRKELGDYELVYVNDVYLHNNGEEWNQ